MFGNAIAVGERGCTGSTTIGTMIETTIGFDDDRDNDRDNDGLSGLRIDGHDSRR